MPKIYSQDLRERAIKHWLKYQCKSKTAAKYDINCKTFYNWIDLYEEQGHTLPKPFKPVGVKHIITDLEAFENYVKSQTFDTANTQYDGAYYKKHCRIY